MDDLPNFQSTGMSTSSVGVGNLMSTNLAGAHNLNYHGGTITVRTPEMFTVDTARPFPFHPQGEPIVAAPVAVKPTLRIVRVFLVDPDERIPVEERILYRSDELTTDATDMELYHEIEDLKGILARHNASRKKIRWEEKTDAGTKTHTGLKEIRLRDLIFSTTLIAAFAGKA